MRRFRVLSDLREGSGGETKRHAQQVVRSKRTFIADSRS